MDPRSGVHTVLGEPAVPESQPNAFYSTGIPTAYKYAHIIVAYCNLHVGVVRLLTYFLVEIE